MHRPTMFLATATMLAGLAGCSDPVPVYVDSGFVRLNPNPNAPSAAYFTIHAGKEAVVLRDVQTDEAVRLEIHESMTMGGVASMKPVKTLEIPANSSVKLEPGGKHIMLWSINPQALADGKMSFTFTFSNGDRIIADATVQQPGGGAIPAAENSAANGQAEHSGH